MRNHVPLGQAEGLCQVQDRGRKKKEKGDWGERKEVKEWNRKGRGVCVKGPGGQVEEGE